MKPLEARIFLLLLNEILPKQENWVFLKSFYQITELAMIPTECRETKD